jgi:hypothetical protein
MTPEEKNALLQFTGQMYGESKKNDDMLVGSSPQLQPRSTQIKDQFEQVLRSPVQQQGAPLQKVPPNRPPQAVPAQSAAPAAVLGAPAAVTPAQAAAELAQVQETVLVDPNQMEFDLTEPNKVDKVIELLEKNNRLLVEIRDNSIKSNYNAKRAKNKKPH